MTMYVDGTGIRSIRRTSLLLAAVIASACTTPGDARRAPIESRDENGFTITERVRIGLGVRADFASAIRLLEEEELDRGIALLEKVTEAAPHLTTVHIDLGIAHRRAGDLERAEASLRRALELPRTF